MEEHLLEQQAGIVYKTAQGKWRGTEGEDTVPRPGLPGSAGHPMDVQRLFWDIHPKDNVYNIPWEGGPYLRCKLCNMQCNPAYSKHVQTKTCQVGRERQEQRDMAINRALALHQLFYVNGDVLGKVHVFRYLGHIMSQDDDNIRAVGSQIKKARGIWAQIPLAFSIWLLTAPILSSSCAMMHPRYLNASTFPETIPLT